MVGVFMIAKVYDVVKGDTTKPADTQCPKMPSTPPSITAEMSNADAEKAARYWTQFNVQMNYYNTQLADYNRKMSAWTDGNSQSMGIFNCALDVGIWDQVKDMTAAATWTWLGERYAKSSITELLEHFRYIKDYRFDLSDPSPQLAQWMYHYGSIPARMISASLASIILISNLPMTNNVGQESVYQCLVETMFKDETVATFDLAKTVDSVCDVWAACFGGLPPSQQPRKGTTYDKGKAPANKPQQKQQTQVQRNTAIKGKGPNPQFSEQQSADSGSSQQKKKRPFRRGGKGKGAHSHMAGAPDTYNSDFVLASTAMHIADTPALPAPTAHSVTSFSAAGPSTRREKATGPWRNPGQTTPPYPHVQRSHNLMSCLGVTPTIQTSKEFEGIASLEEVTDGTFGTPTVKLGAYTIQDPELETPAFRWGAYSLTDPVREPPRAPTPEMAPMLDAMVIDVPSGDEDTVSLGEEDPIPQGSGLFGDDEDDAPLPQGLKLNLDNDTSDYGDDPETLCGPIIEPAPAPEAGPSRTTRRA